MFEKISFIKADIGRIGIAFNLLKEAALWLHEKNIDYWQNWLDPAEKFRNWIKQGFDAGEFYFVLSGDEVVGMYRLKWEDEMFWGKRTDKAGYIHSFTTKRKYAGMGLGKKILDKIAGDCREKGASFIRLDCGADITGLRKFYEDYGFLFTGERTVEGFKLAFYEMKT